MSDDAWAAAWSRLTNATENAVDAGMTIEEIRDAVDEVLEAPPAEEQRPSGRAKKKK